ncbi:MAG: hypothetical protein NVSMB52_13950 [Chloroflexota bacterium]
MTDITLPQWKAVQLHIRGIGLLAEYVWDLAILLTAYLIATYLRRELPLGKYVGTNYVWHDLQLYVTIALGLALAYALRLSPLPRPRSEAARRFCTSILGVFLTVGTLTVFTPRQSGLQKGYFLLAALVLVALLVPWQATRIQERSVVADLRRLWANRSLVNLWVRYNVRSRYSQTILGILWIVFLPLTTAFVMSIVFSQIMLVHISNVPFIAFFLAGFVPWGLFNQAVGGSMRSVIGNLGLINQIYFPREILVLSALGEALVDTFFMFVTMLVINAIVGIYPNWLYLILPLLILVQVAMTLGIMLIVGWLGVLIRDVPQLVSVLLQIAFYLSAVIYPVSIIPHHYRFFITLNPMGVIIEAYHRIIVYHQMPDWYSLIYPSGLAVGLLVFGYRLFKANEDRMADML